MEVQSAMDMDRGGLHKRSSSTMVSNGIVDIRGRVADKRTTGGWKASPFIILNEVAERLAFYSIAVNMVSFFVLKMHQPLPEAVTHVTDWAGAAFVLTILGAFLADAYLGRFKTIVIFSCVYAVGMMMLTLSGTLESLHPPACAGKVCQAATTKQNAFLYCALSLIALGTGGIKPCVSSFGADQFDEADEKEVRQKFAFFNWFFFAINMGALFGISFMVYIQTKKGWGLGFGVPTAIVICSIFILVSGLRFYRYQLPTGSALTRFAQVLVASCRNHFRGIGKSGRVDLYEVSTPDSDIPGQRKLGHTDQYRFLDKAAMVVGEQSQSSSTTTTKSRDGRWNLCTVTQVEEFKCFVRVLPVWASTIALSVSYAQVSTFFVSQARITDRRLGRSFVIPPGSIPVFTAINALVLVPLYEGVAVPVLRRLTGHRRGITSLQRMGVGLFVSIFALLSAALVENRRKRSVDPTGMSVFWLFPQFFLMGSAEVFTYVGQMEFFYDEATDGTRSLSSAMFLSEVGIGSWISSALVKGVVRASGGEEKGWLRNSLDQSKLDCFYWILCGISATNFVVYLVVAWRYKGKTAVGRSVRDETSLGGREEQEQAGV